MTAIRARILEDHGVSASPNVVGGEVKQFWARTGPLLNARLKRPGIPEAVGQALDAVWDVALNEATAAYAIKRSYYQGQAQREAAEARVEAEQAVGRFADQERQIALLTKQVQRVNAQLDCGQAENKALRAELAELTTQHQSQDQRHRDELARIEAAHAGK